MKGKLRQVWREIIAMMPAGYGLCNFCRFASWYGSCCDAELECEHPLSCINGDGIGQEQGDVWSGADCWAFRPNLSLQELGEIASITLAGYNAHKSKAGYIGIIPSENDKEHGLIGVIV